MGEDDGLQLWLHWKGTRKFAFVTTLVPWHLPPLQEELQLRGREEYVLQIFVAGCEGELRVGGARFSWGSDGLPFGNHKALRLRDCHGVCCLDDLDGAILRGAGVESALPPTGSGMQQYFQKSSERDAFCWVVCSSDRLLKVWVGVTNVIILRRNGAVVYGQEDFAAAFSTQ